MSAIQLIMTKIYSQKDYKHLIKDISFIFERGKKQAYKAVNNILVQTYREIGKRIVEFEQKGKFNSKYGSKVLPKLSKELSHYGKGFSRSNIVYMRLFYIKYPIGETLSHQLGWSHYLELLKVDNDLARSFYEQQCIKEKWSIRELKRQKNSMLFERIALSKDKKGVLKLSQQGEIVETSEDIIKEHISVQYALGGISNKLFVSKYQLYLPQKDELEGEVKRLLGGTGDSL